jgi:hypothetical protein
MHTISRFSILLLLLGLGVTACEQESATTPTNPSPVAKGARSPCGFETIPTGFDPLSGVPTSYAFKFYLCEVVPKRQNWWWYELELGRQMVATLPRTVVDDFRVIPTDARELRANAILLRFAKNALVMQQYQESRFMNRTTFTLPRNLVLTNAQQQAMGLRGNTVLAGAYPVIYDSVRQTYNAVLFTQ